MPTSALAAAMGQPPADPQHERICEALFAGKKIEAIKLYREMADAGLKEAKEFIEALEERLKRDQPERFKKPAPPGGGCLGLLALLAGLAGLAAIFWLLR